MDVEGMVHALEEIRRLLKPTGVLIDIHPIRKAARVKVYQGSALLFAEPNPYYDYKDKTRHADDALEEVVHRGLFHIEGRNEFDLITYASSVSACRDYWAKYDAFDDEPKDEAITALQNEVYDRADEIMQNALDAELADYERARITRLKPSVAGR
jgi:hypothetical protein